MGVPSYGTNTYGMLLCQFEQWWRKKKMQEPKSGWIQAHSSPLYDVHCEIEWDRDTKSIVAKCVMYIYTFIYAPHTYLSTRSQTLSHLSPSSFYRTHDISRKHNALCAMGRRIYLSHSRHFFASRPSLELLSYRAV